MRDNTRSALQTARDYIERGWNPVPVPHKTKGPRGTGWQNLLITEENVVEHFGRGPANIGVQLGPKSRGLTDIDLDCQEAVELAPQILPSTSAVFGRVGKPRSHWLYYITDPEDRANIKLTGVGKDAIIELRMGGKKGAQTIFPGSTHPTGERIEWASDGEPAASDYATLKAAITKIAVGVILIRAWPAKGSRHDASLALGGFLARAGWGVGEIMEFARLIADQAGSTDAAARAKAAASAAEGYTNGANVYGKPHLIETFGEAEANKVAELLNYRTGSASQATPSGPDPLIDKLNTEYALVLVGGKGEVMKTEAGGTFQLLSGSAFDLWLANQSVIINDRRVPLAKHWIQHPLRRQYEGIVFAPDRLRIAVVCVTHLNKGGGGNQSALNRFVGSIAFTAAARAAFAVIEDSEDETRRLFLQVKNNLGKSCAGLAFRIEQALIPGDILASRITWDTEPVAIDVNSALQASEAVGGGGGRTNKDEAADFLQKLLTAGPLPVKEVEAQAVEAGLLGEGKPIGQNKAFRAARDSLQVVANRAGGLGGDGRWEWALPDAPKMPTAPYDALSHTQGTLDTLGILASDRL